MNAHELLAPDPFGPVIGGVDIFKAAVQSAMSPHDVRVQWVNDWDRYHDRMGEVHCGTNVVRAMEPTLRWWNGER